MGGLVCEFQWLPLEFAVGYESQPKWRSLFNSVNYYGDELNQVDGFDTQNISSIFNFMLLKLF